MFLVSVFQKQQNSVTLHWKNRIEKKWKMGTEPVIIKHRLLWAIIFAFLSIYSFNYSNNNNNIEMMVHSLHTHKWRRTHNKEPKKMNQERRQKIERDNSDYIILSFCLCVSVCVCVCVLSVLHIQKYSLTCFIYIYKNTHTLTLGAIIWWTPTGVVPKPKTYTRENPYQYQKEIYRNTEIDHIGRHHSERENVCVCVCVPVF